MFAPIAGLALSTPKSSLRSLLRAMRRDVRRLLLPRSLRAALTDSSIATVIGARLLAGKNGGDNKNNSKSDKSSGGDKKKKPNELDDPEDEMTARLTFFVVAMFVVSYILYRFSRPSGEHAGWPTIAKHAERITDVLIYHNFVQVYTDDKCFFLGVYDDEHTNDKLVKIHEKYGKDQRVNFQVLGTPLAEQVLFGFGLIAWVVPFIFFPSFVMMLTRAMGTAVAAAGGEGGRSRIKQMNFTVQFSSETRFHDVAGMKEAKQEITEIVDFLKQPLRYSKLGAKIPTGALLLGPPGTGKTLLARAVAGEAGVGFIPVCGSDFVELYVGMGALRVRQLFELAKKQRCIVYIDEIDAIGMKRRGAGHGEKQEQEHTLNELLTQLDGFGSARGQVMILASSNVPQDQLDPALIRPGRFDRIVHVDSPVLEERIEIFKVHLCKLKLVPDAAPTSMTTTVNVNEEHETSASITTSSAASSSLQSDPPAVPTEENATAPVVAAAAVPPPLCSETALSLPIELPNPETTSSFDVNALLKLKTPEVQRLILSHAERMSRLCPGFVGADIANVCNEAAILAAREDCTHVSIGHLERSIDRVIAGIEHRSRVLSPFEKNVVAHHEAGHAVAGWFLNRADPLMKVSIVPRGGSALGYAQYLPNENKMRTANEIIDSMCVTLGGRVAEKIFFDHWSTGASDDLQKVCRMAYMHVTSFGGVTVNPPPGSESTKYVKPYGSSVSDKYDLQAKQLVDSAYDKTMKLLLDKKKEMEFLAKHLLDKEMLTYQDVVAYLGERESRVTDKKRGV